MSTYCQNADLIMDNGRSINEYIDPTQSENPGIKNAARRQAYAEINDNYLKNRTLVPAFDKDGDLTIPSLLYIEKDLAISYIMKATFSGETGNLSEWANHYRERAIEALKNLKWDATYSSPTANSQNTGNGTVTIHMLFEEFVRTENWILRATGSTTFSVYGTKSGRLPNATVGERYPEYDWNTYSTDYGLRIGSNKQWIEYPFHMTIAAGLVDFISDDIFYFATYSSHPLRQRSRRINLA